MDLTVQDCFEELMTVMTSKMLRRAPNLAKILEFVCIEHLEGRGANIKEYTVAVEGLARDPSFDPTRDSIVRVEVTRLRKRLEQYYQSEGAGHRIKIRLQPSGYIPEFVEVVPQASEEMGQNASAVPQPSRSESPRDRLEVSAPESVRPAVHRLGLAWLITGLVASGLILAVLLKGASTPRNDLAPSTQVEPSLVKAGPTSEVRIAAGSSVRYRDNAGRVWEADEYYSGGTVVSTRHSISGTYDPAVYQHARQGDFSYDIPLKPGVYELHLHFAEIVMADTVGSTSEGARRFFVTLSNKPLLNDFDISLDAQGSNTADERVFKDLKPGPDGFLHLRFRRFLGGALLSGIEILPGTPGKMTPVRILAGPRTYEDLNGAFWGPDRYFVGGTFKPQTADWRRTFEPEIYNGARIGNFRYAIPVAAGRYAVNLYFADPNFGVHDFGTSESGGGVGSRLFDVSCNGVMLEKELDIFKEAGGPRSALLRTFHDLTPNAQGKLVISVTPVKDYATVAAIEVMDESDSQSPSAQLSKLDTRVSARFEQH